LKEKQAQKNRDPISAGREWLTGIGTGAKKNARKVSATPPRIWMWFLLALLANYFLARLLFPGPEAPVTVPYTLFKEEVGRHNVEAIFSQSDNITGLFRGPITSLPGAEKSGAPISEPGAVLKEVPKSKRSFRTTLPAFVGPGLEDFLIGHGVEISAKPIQEERNLLATILFSFGPGLLIIGFYFWFLRRSAQQGGGILGIGKSKARRYDQETDVKVTFNDVAGIDEARNELMEVVDFLKDPKKVYRLGRDCSERGVAGGRSWHRQNPACESGCRRGGGAVLLDECCRIR